jgi:hypothetical protein
MAIVIGPGRPGALIGIEEAMLEDFDGMEDAGNRAMTSKVVSS